MQQYQLEFLRSNHLRPDANDNSITGNQKQRDVGATLFAAGVYGVARLLHEVLPRLMK